jgi:hypothetical protein
MKVTIEYDSLSDNMKERAIRVIRADNYHDAINDVYNWVSVVLDRTKSGKESGFDQNTLSAVKCIIENVRDKYDLDVS